MENGRKMGVIVEVRPTARPYADGGEEIIFTPTPDHRGRLPGAERTLTNGERRERKNQALGKKPKPDSISDRWSKNVTAVKLGCW